MRKLTALFAVLMLSHGTIDYTAQADEPKQAQTYISNSGRFTDTSAKADVNAYLTSPFDTNIQNLPSNFRGHDIEELYNALWRRKPSPGKDKSQKERPQEQTDVLAGTLTFGSILAFVVDNPVTVYDAAVQKMGVMVKTLHMWDGVEIDRSKLAIGIKSVFKGKSIAGANASAAVEVIGRSLRNYEVAITNHYKFPLRQRRDEEFKRITDRIGDAKYSALTEDLKSDAFEVELNFSPQDAEKAKDNIRSVLICCLVPPYASYGTLLRQVTLDNPDKLSVQKFYLNVKLIEVWIYDKTSGVILSKIKSR
ncbi:MAG: hypothetical protein L7F78_05420 [Syntrophales bacterium LBB04]|nr:hypothetical protein [Syntrophales bacterium LBB04]